MKTKPELDISFNKYKSLSKEEKELLLSIDEYRVDRFIKNYIKTVEKKSFSISKKDKKNLFFEIINENLENNQINFCYLKIQVNNKTIIEWEQAYNLYSLLQNISYKND